MFFLTAKGGGILARIGEIFSKANLLISRKDADSQSFF
jgi:hypothetical protein